MSSTLLISVLVQEVSLSMCCGEASGKQRPGFGLTLKGKNICVLAGGRWLDVVAHNEYCMYGVLPEAISPNSELGKRNGHCTKLYVHYNKLCTAKLTAMLR